MVLVVRKPLLPLRNLAARFARFRPRDPSAPLRKIDRISVLFKADRPPWKTEYCTGRRKVPTGRLHISAVRADTPPMKSRPSATRIPAYLPDTRPHDQPLASASGARRLDPWQRYQALNDALDEAYQLIDISNREARFALIMMGTLNAIVVVAASRSEFVDALDARQRIWAASLLGIYGVTAVHFLFQAIEALRPGRFKPKLGDWSKDADDFPLRVRYYEDVIRRDVQSHWRAWSDVDMTQLNAELAIQLHSLCVKSNAKRVALARLFAGLRIMTLMVTGLAALFVYAVWM